MTFMDWSDLDCSGADEDPFNENMLGVKLFGS